MARRPNWVTVGGVLSGVGALVAGGVGLAQLIVDESPPTVVSPQPSPSASISVTSPTSSSPAPDYVEYGTITDDTGTISVQVPAEWSNQRSNWNTKSFPPYRGVIGPGLGAAPNVDAWAMDNTTPGVFIGVSAKLVPEYEPVALAKNYSYAGCTLDSLSAYAQGGLTGESATWVCSGTSKRWFHLAASPDDGSYLLFAQVKLVSERDDAALEHILDSLRVSGYP